MLAIHRTTSVEESIEGQIRECTAYAEKNGVHLISVMEPIAEDKFYHLDPLTSPLVLEAFQRYDNGDKRNQCHWAHLLLLQVCQRQAAQGLQ